MAKHSLDFWLTSEDLPDPNNRVTLDSNGGIVLSYKPNNEEGHKRLIAKLKELMQQQTKCKIHGHECHRGTVRSQPLRRSAHSPGRCGASSRHGSLRQRSENQRAGRQLQSARRGQSLRRRWQLFLFQRRGEPSSHHHGQRAASGRPSDSKDEVGKQKNEENQASGRKKTGDQSDSCSCSCLVLGLHGSLGNAAHRRSSSSPSMRWE